MARNRIINWLDKKRVDTTESLLPYDLGDELIGALRRANLAEPLDGEEFDDLSDERKQQMRETM
jgi:hypothetical protein